jgi:hypothetical protein
MTTMEAETRPSQVISTSLTEQLLGNGHVPWFDDRHEDTSKKNNNNIGSNYLYYKLHGM